MTLNGTSFSKCTYSSECVDTKENFIEINWDDEVVVKTSWYDKTLFNLGEVRFTTGSSVIAVGIILVLVLIISAVMSYLAYVKRETLKVQLRRGSDYVRRTSQKHRASIGREGRQPHLTVEETIEPVN